MRQFLLYLLGFYLAGCISYCQHMLSQVTMWGWWPIRPAVFSFFGAVGCAIGWFIVYFY